MTRAPLLLARPSTWADMSRRAARATVLALVLLIVVAAGIAGDVPAGDAGRSSFAFETGLVEGVRHGGDYYGVAADLVRGSETPARAVVGVRLPTLAVVVAALPARVVPALLATLALAVALAWYERLAPALSRRAARLTAGVLLVGGVAAAFRPLAALVPETWTGLFVALSLARWRPGRTAEAVGWAVAAALIDETAVAAIVLMATFAAAGRERREATGWLGGGAVVLLVVLAHRYAVDAAGVMFADLPRSMAGIGAALAELADATALGAVPVAAAAALLVLAIAGWTAWRDPLGPRTATVSLVLLAVTALSPADGSAALLAAPLTLAGLIFLPDAVRDLAASALDRRRIIVRRVLR